MPPAEGQPSAPNHLCELVTAVVAALGAVDVSRIARYTQLDHDTVGSCIARLRDEGIVGDHGLTTNRYLSTLPPRIIGDIHGAIAEDLLSSGLDRLDEALLHARQAIDYGANDRLLARLDGAATYALASARLADAQRLLEVAEEADHGGEMRRRVQRLELLAEALDGQGLVAAAKDTRARAFEIADLSNHHDWLWRLSTSHALPCDWFEGDHRSSSLLVRAAAVTVDPLPAAAVTAARAMVSMRIPAVPTGSPQVAWVTRPSMAQPLADASIKSTEGSAGLERLLALLAWRTTHRAPTHLRGRRRATAEAIDLAQVLHRSDLVVEIGLFRAVDGFESVDPGMADQAMALARWASAASGNPRLMWQTTMTDVGLALMRLDRDLAEDLRARGRQRADECSHPGAFSAEVLFMFQELMNDVDAERLAQIIVPDDSPLLAHPLARAGQAYAQIVCGRREQARNNLVRCLAALDEESSVLLVLHLLARCACALDEREHIERVVHQLRPFASHVAIDAHGWWIAGPVACDLADMELSLGNVEAALRYWTAAQRSAALLDDRRSLTRMAELRRAIDRTQSGSSDQSTEAVVDHQLAIEALSEREREVLDLMVKGRTNREIAHELAYSVSTIRATTMSIYRRLGLEGRPAVIAALHGTPTLRALTTREARSDV
jgi:DNA-binding CsgD family transcriptional regulator